MHTYLHTYLPIARRCNRKRACAFDGTLTPACGPHHHAPGRSRALRDSHAGLSRRAHERRSRRLRRWPVSQSHRASNYG